MPRNESNLTNHPPSIFLSEYAGDPSVLSAQPIAQQVIAVDPRHVAVSAEFNQATRFIKLNPQFVELRNHNEAARYELGVGVLKAPFSKMLNGPDATVLEVGQGQHIAFLSV